MEYAYQSHYTIEEISQNIVNSKLLLRFMPENGKNSKKINKNGY